MTARVAHLCRHPVKSAGYEELGEVRLEAGQGFPFDREWAVAHAEARFGAEGPGGWVSKMNFVRGVASPDLMAVSCLSDPAARRVTLSHPRRPDLTVAPDDAPGALIDWLRPLWPADAPAPARVVRVEGQPMTDKPGPWVAVLSMASLRALEVQMARDLSIHRWRGNIWVDGWAPWAEFDMVGQVIRLGDVELRVECRITRCKATCCDPVTGVEAGDTLAALRAGWGHQDFGVYASVIRGGRAAVGDQVGNQVGNQVGDSAWS